MKCKICDVYIQRYERYTNFYYCIECDKTYEYEIEEIMDKKIKKIIKKTDSLEKDEKKLLKLDKKNDKIVDKAKSKMKGKC